MTLSDFKKPGSLISEIYQKAAVSDHHFLLLEGDFDLRFWEEKLNPKTVQPIECGGKPHVTNTLKLLQNNSLLQRVFGLIDADFDRLLNREPSHRLVWTDENDLETTLLLLRCSHPPQQYIERLINATVKPEARLQREQELGCNLLEHIRQIASQYGLLRYLNALHGWCINFENHSLLSNQWFDHKQCCLNVEKLHEALLSQLNPAWQMENLQAEIQKCQQQNLLQGWQLVQGHDLLKVMACILQTLPRHGGQQISEDSLQRDLILSIHWQDLQNCPMVKTLQAEFAPSNPFTFH